MLWASPNLDRMEQGPAAPMPAAGSALERSATVCRAGLVALPSALVFWQPE